MADGMNRRAFVKTSAGLMAGAALAGSQAAGANERIRMGFIGVANRGGQLLDATFPHEDGEIVALCDVYEPALRKAAEKVAEKTGAKVDQYGDFRKVIERKDIDAIVIGTPDHWHAIQTIDACDAGKDVYVEKPLSITIHEGRRMVEAARRNKRVVQVGTHRRSGAMYAELAERVQGGLIGKVTSARAYRISNMWPKGIGKVEDCDPPEDLDWDMWLGPRAWRNYRPNICPYKFRWWSDYSSQIGNWGVHYFDAMRWIIGEEAPTSAVALGGRYVVDDDRDIPDTMEAMFEMPSGCIISFGQYEASSGAAMRRGDLELRGTLGTLYIDDRGYEVVPARGGQFQDTQPRMEPVNEKAPSGNRSQTERHMRNFLDCIKSRERPNADVEIGHCSTSFSHLGNISLKTKARLEWDAQSERITNNDDANKLLHYEYRPPWKLG